MQRQVRLIYTYLFIIEVLQLPADFHLKQPEISATHSDTPICMCVGERVRVPRF
jgi:hypothetical protein